MTPENGRVGIALDDAERHMMVCNLIDYHGVAQRGLELLPPVVGTSSYAECARYIVALKDAVEEKQPLSELDWARALFLTEIVFGCDVLGASRHARGNDEHWLPVLRSLQANVSTEHRARLLQHNTTFPPPTHPSNGQTSPIADNIELDDDQHTLMQRALTAYTRHPRRGATILAPLTGQPTYNQWVDYTHYLANAITDHQPLTELHWTRALFLTEIGFTSALLGFPSQFRDADAHFNTALHTLQDTIRHGPRYLRFIENATYPWYPDE